ncbi:hypothetical protein CRE_31555 [Caenorhabditis remanei]|uniref:Uncharacterized protein n=1 Tax=Caenorhabditis remanei TaxID=31234 RepID=E3NKM2_CAERE|nr:hypothetical protein CRE_31555 [Caenorhabditis remanei]
MLQKCSILFQMTPKKPPESQSKQVPTLSESSLQNALSEEENETNREIIERFEQEIQLKDERELMMRETQTISAPVFEEARRLKRETGYPRYRLIDYSCGELSNSNLSEPPSPSNPHPFDPSDLPPVHSLTLVPFVNHSPLLRFLVDIGVDLAEIENTTSIGRHLLRLEMEDVRLKIELMQKEIGFENEEIGSYLTRNPFFLIQDVNDMRTRLNYLEMKKFTKPERRKIVKEYRYWLNCNVELIDSRLGWLQQQFKLNAKTTREIIVKEPRIIMFGTGPLERLVKMFTKELNFSQTQLKTLVTVDPRLFMMDAKLVSRTYKYVRDVMRINNETILEHPFILRCSLSVIKSRHDFLNRLGRAHYQLAVKKESRKDASEIIVEDSDDSHVDLVKLEHFLHASDAGFAMLAAKTFPVAYDKFLRNS